MPSATSSAIEPVGITSIGARASSPRRMTEPLPNCFSIWASATSSAFSRSAPAMSVHPLPGPVVPSRRVRSVCSSSGQTLDRATDSPRDARCGLWRTSGRGRLQAPSNPNTCSTRAPDTPTIPFAPRAARRVTVSGVSALVIRAVDPHDDADMDAFQDVYAAAERPRTPTPPLYSREDGVALLTSTDRPASSARRSARSSTAGWSASSMITGSAARQPRHRPGLDLGRPRRHQRRGVGTRLVAHAEDRRARPRPPRLPAPGPDRGRPRERQPVLRRAAGLRARQHRDRAPPATAGRLGAARPARRRGGAAPPRLRRSAPWSGRCPTTWRRRTSR